MRVGRAGRIGALLAGVVVLVLVLAQLFLPGIAASMIRARIEKYGTVRGVTVKAWPFITNPAPTTDGSLPNFSCQVLKLIMATAAAPFRSSFGVMVRPM